MKAFLFPMSTLVLAMMLSSCGKKVQVKEQKKVEGDQPSVEEVYFNAFKEMKRAVNENDLPAVKKIILENPGLELNHLLTDSGETYLTLAIKKDFREIRNFLIEKGCQLEKANVNKETPLIAAVSSNRINSIKVLLDHNVELERKDNNGDTALHVALKKGNDEAAVLLIKQGADIHALDKHDRNALRLAQDHRSSEALELIKSIMEMEFGAPNLEGFRTIVLSADHKRLNNILTRYPKIATEKAYQSINPLALLVSAKDEAGALRSAELLINYEANVNGPEDAEETPLIKATIAQKKGFADLYLSSKANPQILDKDGKSALFHAIELNKPDMVDLLIRYSAPEKYTFRKNGKRITFNACETAKEVGKKLTDEKEKADNVIIKKRLLCGFWPF